MPLGLVHGYGFSGAGSNLWTRAVLRALTQLGHEVHVVCQESHPERFDFVNAAFSYDDESTPEQLFERETPYSGRVVVHRPTLATLPTFVRPSRPSDYVVYIPDLSDDRLDDYLARNERVLTHVAAEHNVAAWTINHVVMMAVAAARAREAGSVPYAVLPHGSAIEYVVKKEERSRRLAEQALRTASRVYALNGEMEGRIRDVFGHIEGIEAKVERMPVGVDTTLFDVADRADRPRLVARIAEAIADEPRGRTAVHEAGLRDALATTDERPPLDALLALFAEADYARSAPDAHAEAKLEGIEWPAKTVLYVGRLIAAKGIPSVVMAFPDVVRQHPDARLLIAGAGGLREAMEALVWALSNGRRDLVEHLVGLGGALEAGGLDPVPFAAAQGFLDRLDAEDQLDDWFAVTADHLTTEHVVFTGYLDHDALAPLYGLADVGVFPSVVREASPLVIPESAASGAFPIGTDFGGMGDSLSVVGEGLPEDVRPLLKARPEPEHTVTDLAHHIAAALERPRAHAAALRQIAEKRFDWRAIAARLAGDLEALGRSA